MKHEGQRAATHARPAGLRLFAAACLAIATAASLAGCNGFGSSIGSGFSSLGYDGTIQRGYVQDARLIDALKTGQSKEQVLSTLGTPSTTSTVGGDAWYYISQTVNRPVAFMPDRITDQRVLAVYFRGAKMERVANYGIEDGKLFDYISRTTPVAGGDASFIQNMIKGVLKFS